MRGDGEWEMGNGEMKLNRYPKYKPTGIAWLPEVPEGWEVIKVGYCFDENGSGTTPLSGSKDYYDGPINWVQSGDLHRDNIYATKKTVTEKALQDYSLKIFQPPFVCMAMYGASIANVSMVRVSACTNQACCVLAKNRANTDLDYLYRCLGSESIRQALLLKAQGGTQPNINRGDILSTRIPLPPLAEQRAIVAYLDEKCGKIDRWVAAKEWEVALLKELKQAMIAEAVTGATKVARTDTARKMKPTGIPWLPEVPEGWEVRRLVSLFSNGVKSNKDFVYSRALKFNYGTLIPKNELGDPEEYRDVYVKYSLLQKGDIVINGLNLNYDFNSMRVACAPCDGIITSAYIVCRPRLGIDTSYFTYLFKAMDYQKMFHGMGTGIRLTLSFNELRGQFLPVPPLAEQREIVAYLDEKCGKIDAAVAGLEREVAAMKEYKQRLIADVVTGQRKVA